MAIDLTQIAQDIAAQTVTEVNALAAVLTALEGLNVFANDSGVGSFVTFEEAIQEQYPHLDGAKLNQALGVIAPALLTWLDAQTVSGGDYAGATYMEMLNKVRTQ